jgi:hypothetical protein
VAAAAGVAAGLSAGAAGPAGPASSLAELSHAPARVGVWRVDTGSAPVLSGQGALATLPAGRPAVPPAPESTQRPGRIADRNPARPAQVVHRAPPAHRAAAPRPVHPAPAKPAAPYLIYDSVLPGAIPPHSMVATYATGPYAASPSQVAGRQVMWIDVYGTDYEASALDVEPTDATPDQAASWAYHRLSLHPDAIAHIYTSISEWPQVQAACAALPARMQSHIRWWIADPTGVPHIVPGSDATQWFWGSSYDISTATPRF